MLVFAYSKSSYGLWKEYWFTWNGLEASVLEHAVFTEPWGKSLYLGVSKHQVLSVGLQTMIQT